MLAQTPLVDLAKPAEDLGITDVERAALCRVHEMLDGGRLPATNPIMPVGNSFDMRVWQRKESCGTVACIAGWANLIDRRAFPGVGTAQWLFGLDPRPSRLFCPDLRFDPITPAMAVRALRTFLIDGEADWS